ncbi:MAG: CRISPR-associated protein Cas4 [Chthonomonadales bacterium]|nr:CRISPR-associated protein Cas4 [Chthonomonadales bacterium]
MRDAPIPVSQLNKLVFCPRRFYYEYVLGEWQDNAYTITGTMRHERADTPGHESRAEKVTTRAVSVASERLGIVGRLDVLEESNGALLPVEYKSGACSEHGPWRNDAIQLCALALCLEERTGRRIPKGVLFTFGDRVRRDVVFTETLRAQTEEVIAEAHALANLPEIPAPVYSRRCEGCSLKPICMPQEVAQMQKGRRGADNLQALVETALEESETAPPKRRRSSAAGQLDAEGGIIA